MILTEHAKDVKVDTVVIVQILKDKILWQESKVDYWKPKLIEKIRQYSKILNG